MEWIYVVLVFVMFIGAFLVLLEAVKTTCFAYVYFVLGTIICMNSCSSVKEDAENGYFNVSSWDVAHNCIWTFKGSKKYGLEVYQHTDDGLELVINNDADNLEMPILDKPTVIGVEFGIDSKTEHFLQTADVLDLLKILTFECDKSDGNLKRLSSMLGFSPHLIYKWLEKEGYPDALQEENIRKLYRDFEYSRYHHLIYYNGEMSQFEALAKNWKEGNIEKFRNLKKIYVDNLSYSAMLFELCSSLEDSKYVANYLQCSSSAIERLLNKETEPTDEFLQRVKNMYLSFVLLNKEPNLLNLVRYGIGDVGIFFSDYKIDCKDSPQLNEWTDVLETGVEQYENNVSNNNLDSITIEQYIKNEEKLNEAFVSSFCKTMESIFERQKAKFVEDRLEGPIDNLTNIKDLYISDKQEFEKIIKDMDSTYFGPQHFYPQLKIIESDYISKVKKTRAHFVSSYKIRVDVSVNSIKTPEISTKGLKNYTEDIGADYLIEGLKGFASSALGCVVARAHPLAGIGVEVLASVGLEKKIPSEADSITEILKQNLDSQFVINPEEINNFINLLNNNSRSFYEKIL